MKKCIKCDINKDYNQFHIKRANKDGYVDICKSCKKVYDMEYRQKNKILIKSKRSEYYQKNKKEVDKKNLEYKIKNKNTIDKYQSEYRENNKDSIKKYQKEYREKNRNKRNSYNSERKKNDIIYKISVQIRLAILTSFRRGGFSKKSKTNEILGCSFEEFKIYLESKFESWMDWNNRGLYNGEFNFGWDIDHIIPLSAAEKEEDLYKLNHYTNLQPLCSKINRDIKKSQSEFFTTF